MLNSDVHQMSWEKHKLFIPFRVHDTNGDRVEGPFVWLNCSRMAFSLTAFAATGPSLAHLNYHLCFEATQNLKRVILFPSSVRLPSIVEMSLYREGYCERPFVGSEFWMFNTSREGIEWTTMTNVFVLFSEPQQVHKLRCCEFEFALSKYGDT